MHLVETRCSSPVCESDDEGRDVNDGNGWPPERRWHMIGALMLPHTHSFTHHSSFTVQYGVTFVPL